MISHPPRMTRDTATYRPYQKAHGRAGGKLRSKSLKTLAQELLGRTIQTGQHSPVSLVGIRVLTYLRCCAAVLHDCCCCGQLQVVDLIVGCCAASAVVRATVLFLVLLRPGSHGSACSTGEWN